VLNKNYPVLVFAVWVFIILSDTCSAQELLRNPDFEGGFRSTSYGSIGNYWDPCGRPSLAGSYYASGSASGYGYFQRVTPGAIGSEAGICQRVSGLIPGKTIRFSVQVYQKVPNCSIWIAIDADNTTPPGQLPPRTTQVPYNSGQWTTWEITATVGAGGTVGVYIWNYYESGTANYININNTSLTYIDRSITDLAVTSALSDSLRLQWTAPSGAAKYQVRYSTQPITSDNWNSASIVAAQMTPIPAGVGTLQTMWVRGLQAGSNYWFAIKFKDSSGVWSNVSNSPNGTTTPAGKAPYWAWATKEKLSAWYSTLLAECQTADENSGATANEPDNPLHWYFGGWDSDCERQPLIGALLQIVRDPWMLGFLGKLSDHVWDLCFTNTPLDKNIYNSTWPHQRVPMWNESHHAGECSWNGVSLTALDYNNPKWLQRLIQYASLVHNWTGYTGNPPHLHFKTFWVKEAEWDYSSVRGPQSLVDNPEDRRFTRALWYAAWRDPNSTMPDGQTIKNFLYELDKSAAEDAMKTDLDKPLGLIPGEIRFDTHQIGGYSGEWWRMAGGIGGTPGVNERFWDWRYGFVQSRDAYCELIDQYITGGDETCKAAVRETIRCFNVINAINNIPPEYMFDPPTYPWPDWNDPWGSALYVINYLLYRRATCDTQFDQYWLAHADTIWQKLPAPGAPRYQVMWRSTLTWDTNPAYAGNWTAANLFFVAWTISRDKEWLSRALDEMPVGSLAQVSWTEAIYTGMPCLSISRLPDQPITWNNTSCFTNFAALVLDWDSTQIKWLTYNFDPTEREMPIWLWSLQPGSYVLRHGPDTNNDDRMDYVAETVPFIYAARRTPLTIMLPADRMEVWEITPAEQTLASAKSMADFSPVSVSGLIVTAVFDGFFYAQNAERTTGIRIESSANVKRGDVVNVIGYMDTISGERCIRCKLDPHIEASSAIPAPLAMTNRALGGGKAGLQKAVWDGSSPARGINNIGLLVTTFGTVIDHGSNWILIDDGSGCDAAGTATGVKVMTSASPPIGSYVAVTGVSSCEIPPHETEPVRLIRAVADGVRQLQ